MATGRHSYVRFFPSDWLGGTARMTRIHRSVYFEICLYNWDKHEPCPPTELALMLLDLENGSAIVAQLVGAGKLMQDERGVWSPRAMEEADYAYDQWERRSKGGKAYRPTEGKSKSVGKTVRKTRPTLIVSNNQNQTLPLKGKSISGEFVLPDWVPRDEWDGWMDMRKRKGIPNTDRAKTLAVKALEKLRDEGHDPAKLLDLATLNGWQSVYPAKDGSTLSAKAKSKWNGQL